MFKFISILMVSSIFLGCEAKEKETLVSMENQATTIRVTDGVEISTPKTETQIKEKKVEVKNADGVAVKIGEPLKIQGGNGNHTDWIKKSCAKGNCDQTCTGEKCVFNCVGGTCSQACSKGALVCSFACAGGNCTQDCVEGSSCTFTCAGGGCTQSKNKSNTFAANCTGGNCTNK